MNLEFFPGGGAVLFAGERIFIRIHKNDFGRCINLATGCQVSANGSAGAVADTQVQVRAIHTYSTGKTYNFEMATSGRCIGLISEADGIISQAA